MHVSPAHAWNVIGFFHLDSSAAQASNQLDEVSAPQCRVRFASWVEIFFNPDVDLHGSAAKPHAAALGQQWWLGKFLHAQQVAVEAPRSVFTAGRRSELNVVDRGERVLVHALMLRRVSRRGRFAC